VRTFIDMAHDLQHIDVENNNYYWEYYEAY